MARADSPSVCRAGADRQEAARSPAAACLCRDVARYNGGEDAEGLDLAMTQDAAPTLTPASARVGQRVCTSGTSPPASARTRGSCGCGRRPPSAHNERRASPSSTSSAPPPPPLAPSESGLGAGGVRRWRRYVHSTPQAPRCATRPAGLPSV